MSTIIRAKDYTRLFSISLITAKRWIAHDRKYYNLKRITARHVMDRYGFSVEDIRAVLG